MIGVGELITEVMRREGWDKFTNHAADRGGPTKYGITQKTLSAARGRPASIQDVRDLSEAEARSIYFTLFVRGPGFSLINDERLLSLAVDCGVNHGPERVIKWLQEIVGVTKDGKLGPITAARINSYDPGRLFYLLAGRRVRFFGEIITRDWKRAMEKAKATPSLADDMALSELQAMFAHGWCNRVAEFIES